MCLYMLIILFNIINMPKRKKQKKFNKLTKPEIIFPNVNDEIIKLVWDYNKDTNMSQVKHNNIILYEEAAIIDGYRRYIHIGGLLKAQYGDRLIEFEPTESSSDIIYGDDWFAIDSIVSFQKSLLNK